MGREAGFVTGYALQGSARQRVSGSDMLLRAVVELVGIFVLVFTGAAIATQLSGCFFSGSDAPGATSWSRRPRAYGVEEPHAVR